MIEAHDLSRRYGGFTAVDGVSFSVDEGEIVGLLGPNGAGKTTTIRMVSGFLPPSGGRVTVDGRDLFREPRRARRELGYLPENVALYPEMRVGEYLAYRGRLQGMGRGELRTALGETVERTLLKEVEGQVIGTLSKGYRQRVALAAAILHGPRVLVLDEPTVGLDPKQIIAIRELIRDLGRSRTLLLSTHILPEVELLCHRVLIVDRGRIVAQGTPAELSAAARQRHHLRVTVRPGGTAGEAEVHERLAALPGVEALEPIGTAEPTEPPTGTADGPLADAAAADAVPAAASVAAAAAVACRLAVAAGADPREAVFRAAVDSGWVLLELAEERASLEDVFVRLTTGDAATPDGTSSGEDAR